MKTKTSDKVADGASPRLSPREFWGSDRVPGFRVDLKPEERETWWMFRQILRLDTVRRHQLRVLVECFLREDALANVSLATVATAASVADVPAVAPPQKPPRSRRKMLPRGRAEAQRSR